MVREGGRPRPNNHCRRHLKGPHAARAAGRSRFDGPLLPIGRGEMNVAYPLQTAAIEWAGPRSAPRDRPRSARVRDKEAELLLPRTVRTYEGGWRRLERRGGARALIRPRSRRTGGHAGAGGLDGLRRAVAESERPSVLRHNKKSIGCE